MKAEIAGIVRQINSIPGRPLDDVRRVFIADVEEVKVRLGGKSIKITQPDGKTEVRLTDQTGSVQIWKED